MGLLWDSQHKIDFGKESGGQKLVLLRRKKLGKWNKGKEFVVLGGAFAEGKEGS